MDVDVIVAGGGLAGAATAIALQKAGASVVVVDKAVFPREKPCGEGLLPHGVSLLRALDADLANDVLDGAPSFRGILYHCDGVVARGDFAFGDDDGASVGRGLRRVRFDALVRDHAARAGATLVNGKVDDVHVDDAGVSVDVDEDAGRVVYRAKVVVGADGPRSLVRHRIGLDGGPPSRARYALRQHFLLAPGVPLPERVEVHVLHGAHLGGDGFGYELYVTPVKDGGPGGRNVVGVAALVEKHVMEGASGKPADRLRALIGRCAPLAERLAGADVDGPALACGPLRVHTKGVHKGRAVLVGDAAGYVDAITGEGMSLALATSGFAARAVTDVLGGKDVDDAFAGYRKARAAVFRDHAILTLGLVELARRPFFCRRAVARLRNEPALFSRLLAVNNGTASITSLGFVDALKLAVGAAP